MVLASSEDVARRFPKSQIVVREGTLRLTRTFEEFSSDVSRAKHELVRLGVERGNVIGICAENCYDWLVWDQAAIELAVVTEAFLEGSHGSLENVGRTQGLRAIVMREAHASSRESQVPLALKELSMQERAYTLIEDEDVLSRVYSSGTSGRIKGLEVTRSGTEHLVGRFLEDFQLNSDDRHVIFLPLSNYQQRVAAYGCFQAGVSFMLTSAVSLFEDMRFFRPTFMIAPPVIYETIVRVARHLERDELRQEKIRELLGDSIRFLISGMAPIRKGILEFLNACGFPIFEAYGLTEVGMIAWNRPGSNRVGAVGTPIDPGSVSFGSDSEILCRPAVPLTKQYFGDSAEIGRDVFLPDGCIATGDIGHMEDGFLVLDGRKKDLILTSGGLKFHPEAIERRLDNCDEVAQCVVTNDNGRVPLTAIISVRAGGGGSAGRVASEYLEKMNDGLPAHMRILSVVMTETAFSPENGLLTRNLKPDRQAIARRFLS